MENSRMPPTVVVALLALLAAPFASADGGGAFQTAEAIDLADGTFANGGATLTRDGKSVHLRVALAGLDAGSVYSVWWLVWNKPDRCNSPNLFGGFCLPPPDGGDAPDAVRNAAGFITDEDGTANFSAWLDSGKLPAGLPIFGKLKNGRRAEIHIVVQSHGVPVPGDVGGQMSIPGFKCNLPSDCMNPDQFAFVFPPAPPHDDDD